MAIEKMYVRSKKMRFDFTRKKKEYDAPLKITHCKTCIFFQEVSLMCAKYKMITDPEKTCKSHREKSE